MLTRRSFVLGVPEGIGRGPTPRALSQLCGPGGVCRYNATPATYTGARMTAKTHLSLLSTVLALAALGLPPRSASAARPARGAEAADFPPGPFNDGGRYSLKDFEGKVLVLFFYEQNCPSCREKIPQRNQVVEQFKGKPVKFIAIGPGDTLTDVKSYVRSTQLKMPVFADTLGIMQHRYGQQISLRNIY